MAPYSESELQSLELISDFLLVYKLMQKSRELYGLSSSKILLKVVKESIEKAYDEFQTHYVNKICGPFTALEKIEDFQMAEAAFEFNRNIENLLKLNLKKEIRDYLPLGFADIQKNLEILIKIPEQNFQFSGRSSCIESNSNEKKKESYLEPMNTMREKGKSYNRFLNYIFEFWDFILLCF